MSQRFGLKLRDRREPLRVLEQRSSAVKTVGLEAPILVGRG